MAANKQQGRWFGLFLAGMTVACAGLAWISEGLGKASLVLGLIILAVSFARFIAMKKLEGTVALGAQPAAMKIVGVVVTIAGWLIVLFRSPPYESRRRPDGDRSHRTRCRPRRTTAHPPMACNKNAIWKA